MLYSLLLDYPDARTRLEHTRLEHTRSEHTVTGHHPSEAVLLRRLTLFEGALCEGADMIVRLAPAIHLSLLLVRRLRGKVCDLCCRIEEI